MTSDDPRMAGYSARELLLAATAHQVIAAFRDPSGGNRLSPAADANLHLLEAALQPYAAAGFGGIPK